MKSFIILCSIFASLSLATPTLLGSKECVYGPSFWCSSLSNAKKCSAVTHCIQTIWEKTSLQEDDDGICDLCKEMVAEARKDLLSNYTREAVKKIVKYYCHMIPIKDIELECNTLADDYIEQLIQTLASQMDPHIVCATVGLCNSIKVDKLLQKNKISPTERFVPKKSVEVSLKGSACDNCKTYFTDVIDFIKLEPKEEILNTMLSICGRFGSYSDSCKAIVESYFDSLYSYITTLRPDSVCRFIGICTGDANAYAVSLPRTGDEPCDYCTAMFTFWKNMLVSNTTREEFRGMLMQVCSQIGSFKEECKALVDQYYNEIYDTIISDIQPNQICEAIGICGKHSVFTGELPLWTLFDMRPSNKLPLTKIGPASNHIVGTDEAASYPTPHLSRVELSKTDIGVSSHGQSGFIKNGKNSDLCIMCEFVLHFLQNVLQDKPTRKEIIEELDHVCTYMPHSVVEECQDYVDAYGDQLISFIILEIDPATICPELKLCPGLMQVVNSDSTCVLCEFAITQLEEMLKDNKTEEAVKNALESVCSILPKSIRSECVGFVDQYYDQLLRLLITELTPDEICQEIGLCPNKNSIAALPPPNEIQLPASRLFFPSPQEKQIGSTFEVKQHAVCILCEFIVKELDHYLLSNRTVEKIEEAFSKVCFLLSPTLQDDCLGFLEEYAKPLLEMLVAGELKPNLVCTELKLCVDTFLIGMPKAMVNLPEPSAMKKIQKPQVHRVKKADSDREACFLCDDVAQFTKAYIEIFGIKGAEEIELAICPVFAKDVKKCQAFARENGAAILKLLQKYPAKKVCQMAGYCSGEEFHMLGASKCTWGPAFWCKSQLHATRCNAMDHCKKVVWGDSVPAI